MGITKGALAEAFEFLDAGPGAELRDLTFMFGLTEDAARSVYGVWAKTLGLAEIDDRVNEAADLIS